MPDKNSENLCEIPPIRQPCPTGFGAGILGHSSQNSMSDPKIVSLLMIKANTKKEILSEDDIDE